MRLLAFLLVFVSAFAFAKDADCLLEVGGRTYIKGICDFTAGADGSFGIYTDAYFAQVLIEEKNVASGFWNGEPGVTHAHESLGTLFRKGGCWQNAGAKVCAWATKKITVNDVLQGR